MPLAVLLDDGRLKGKVERWLGYILEHRQPDGWLGPVEHAHSGTGEKVLDPWPQFVLFESARAVA